MVLLPHLLLACCWPSLAPAACWPCLNAPYGFCGCGAFVLQTTAALWLPKLPALLLHSDPRPHATTLLRFSYSGKRSGAAWWGVTGHDGRDVQLALLLQCSVQRAHLLRAPGHSIAEEGTPARPARLGSAPRTHLMPCPEPWALPARPCRFLAFCPFPFRGLVVDVRVPPPPRPVLAHSLA